jgi:dephospho-CoA kinase
MSCWVEKGGFSLVIRVGLTGGIATGKSTVAVIFGQAGAKIIDADQIARNVVQKGLPAWQKVVAHFGPRVLMLDGQINRATLADVVFNDPIQKRYLNAIVHPYVHREIEELTQQFRKTKVHDVVVLDVPLLYEVGMDKDLDKVIVVYVPEEVQLDRLMKRDELSEQSARVRIQSQMPIEEKRRRADIVIDNSGSLETTRTAAFKVYRTLIAQAVKF